MQSGWTPSKGNRRVFLKPGQLPAPQLLPPSEQGPSPNPLASTVVPIMPTSLVTLKLPGHNPTQLLISVSP